MDLVRTPDLQLLTGYTHPSSRCNRSGRYSRADPEPQRGIRCEGGRYVDQSVGVVAALSSHRWWPFCSRTQQLTYGLTTYVVHDGLRRFQILRIFVRGAPNCVTSVRHLQEMQDRKWDSRTPVDLRGFRTAVDHCSQRSRRYARLVHAVLGVICGCLS